jgi:hypothetical protein
MLFILDLSIQAVYLKQYLCPLASNINLLSFTPYKGICQGILFTWAILDNEVEPR